MSLSSVMTTHVVTTASQNVNSGSGRRRSSRSRGLTCRSSDTNRDCVSGTGEVTPLGSHWVPTAFRCVTVPPLWPMRLAPLVARRGRVVLLVPHRPRPCPGCHLHGRVDLVRAPAGRSAVERSAGHADRRGSPAAQPPGRLRLPARPSGPAVAARHSRRVTSCGPGGGLNTDLYLGESSRPA